MKYALLILEDPETLNAKDLTLLNFANSVLKAGIQDQGVECLNAGAYICSLRTEGGSGLRGLHRLLSEAESRKLRSRTLFFDQEPSWVITPPGARS